MNFSSELKALSHQARSLTIILPSIFMAMEMDLERIEEWESFENLHGFENLAYIHEQLDSIGISLDVVEMDGLPIGYRLYFSRNDNPLGREIGYTCLF